MLAYNSGVRTQSVLSKSFAISVLFHVGLLGGLILFVSKPPVVSNAPLRVRILESPGPSVAPPPPPEAAAPPKPAPAPPEAMRRGGQSEKRPVQTERLAPPPVPVPDRPAVTSPPLPPPPQVAARPEPEASAPTPGPAPVPPEASVPAPRPAPPPPGATPETSVVPPPVTAPSPERGGLILKGPPPSAPARPPAPSGSTARGPSLPSIRDQLAGIGKDVLRESGEAQRTISLDDRTPDLQPYLEKLRWRIQRAWTLPDEARQNGLGGESELEFTLNRAGTLTLLRLVHSSGFPLLDQQALLAIRTAAPFDPLPPEFCLEEFCKIRANFYVIPYRYRRN